MKRIVPQAAMLALLAASLVASPTRADAEGVRRFEVTVTNLTRGQVLTPPVVILHDPTFALFTSGEPASAELAALAEDGVTDPLVALLEAEPGVGGFAVAPAALPPGASLTLEVDAPARFSRLSAAGMLAITNDAFFAVEGLRLPARADLEVEADAYDAGSEGNSESCEHIPGPPCGQALVRNLDGAEGFVHVHAGIHGAGDLVPAAHDWRNPVAAISVRRIN